MGGHDSNGDGGGSDVELASKARRIEIKIDKDRLIQGINVIGKVFAELGITQGEGLIIVAQFTVELSSMLAEEGSIDTEGLVYGVIKHALDNKFVEHVDPDTNSNDNDPVDTNNN